MAAAEATALTFVDEEEISVSFLCVDHVDSEDEQRPMSIAAKMRILLMKVERKIMTAMARRSKTTGTQILGSHW